MNKFLKHIGIFSLSLLLLASVMEYMIRNVPNPLAFKRQLIEKHSAEIKTLVIGSSVANCCINPLFLSDSTYNVAISGEWFRFNQILLERYVDSLPRLKHLIWGICYHSLWSDDSKDRDLSSTLNHKIYMNIYREDERLFRAELPYLKAVALRKWSKYYIKRRNTIQNDSLGLDHAYSSANRERDWKEQIPTRVRSHHKPMVEDTEGKLYRENLRRMHEVARLCRERGIRLHLVLPPVHPEYYRLADKKQLEMLYRAIDEVTAQWDNTVFYDYLNDKRFDDNDFYDGNHLNSDAGAEKFSRILREDLSEFP